MSRRFAPHRFSTRRRRQAVGLGILLACLVGIAAGFLRIDPFSDTRTVHATFDDARGIARAGLETTTEVRLAGAKVGDVTDVERVGDDARFTMDLDPDVVPDLRRDATAELRPRTPFEGNAYVDLHPGSRSAPPLRGSIPREQTRTYVGLYEGLSFATEATRARLRGLVRDLGDTLGPDGQRGLRRTLDELPQLTRDLGPGATALGGRHGRELAGAVSGAARTFSGVAKSEQSITPFLRGAEGTFAALDVDRGRALDAAIRTLPATLRSTRTGSRALTAILDRLDPLAADLRPGLRELPGALQAARPFVREARPALVKSRPLLRDVRAALDDGRSATPAARALLAATRPTSSVLNTSLLPALMRRTRAGSEAYMSLLTTLSGASGAFSTLQTEAQGRTPGQLGHGHFVHFEGRFYSGYPTPDLPPCTLLEQVSPELAERLAQQEVCVP